MKNIIIDRKTIALILLTVFLVCGVQGVSHGFFDDIIDVIFDIGGAIGDAVGIVVNVIADTVKVTAEAVGLTIRVIGVIVWNTDSLWDIESLPNGGIIGVVASNLIHLWDPVTGNTTATLRHDADIKSIAFSPDGLLLASASEDGTVQLWDSQTEQAKPPLVGHTDSVLSVAFNFDGSLLASGSADNTIRLWDPNTETFQGALLGHTGSVLSVAFSPDGLLLASASEDGTVRLWDPHIRTLEATLLGHTDSVLSVAFSPDGLLLASASVDNTVRLWDPQTEQQIVSFDHQSPVLSIAFNPDGDLLASGSTDGTARLWNLHPDPQAAKVVATLGHESPVRSVTFSPDGDILYSGSADGKTRQWEITIETETGKIEVVDASTEDASRIAFESSTPPGYTRVTLRKTGRVWGVPTKFTTDSNIQKVTYMLLAKLKGCDFASAELSRSSKVHIKTESLGNLNNYESTSVCGTSSSTWSSSWNGVRITHLRFFDVSSPNSINEAIYNASTDQYELESSSATTPETPTDTDAVVSISPASVASPAIGQQLEFTLSIADGEAVAGYQATVQFDDTVLGYVSSANGDYLLDGAFFVEPVVDGNLVKLSSVSLTGEVNGDGSLATLTFEVIDVKPSTLTLSDVLLTNWAGATSTPHVENPERTEQPEPEKLTSDVNGDGTVNIADLVLVAANLGKTGQNAADVNGDGVVNIADLLLVAGALGTTAAAPSLHPQALEMLTDADVKQWLSAAQKLDLTDTTSLKGIRFLEQLLSVLIPKETALLPNYPNPFNPETWIPYHLAKEADVALTIYAIDGQVVRTLALGHQPAGMYQNRSRAAYWDGRNAFGEPVASGVYFYTLTAGDFTATRKMLIRK